MNAPQVAVNRLGRVQEVAPRTGGGERGGNLLADKPGFAHAADNDTAGATKDQVHRLAKAVIQPGRDGIQRARFHMNDLARVPELLSRYVSLLYRCWQNC